MSRGRLREIGLEGGDILTDLMTLVLITHERLIRSR